MQLDRQPHRFLERARELEDRVEGFRILACSRLGRIHHDDDVGQRVADGIVQLAGDPAALLGGALRLDRPGVRLELPVRAGQAADRGVQAAHARGELDYPLAMERRHPPQSGGQTGDERERRQIVRGRGRPGRRPRGQDGQGRGEERAGQGHADAIVVVQHRLDQQRRHQQRRDEHPRDGDGPHPHHAADREHGHRQRRGCNERQVDLAAARHRDAPGGDPGRETASSGHAL